jgi:hypothetical protein
MLQPLHGFLNSTPQHAVLAILRSEGQIKNVPEVEGAPMSPRELQEKYQAALSKIAGAKISGSAKKHQPIFQREPATTEKQSIQDAANALSALWKLQRQ